LLTAPPHLTRGMMRQTVVAMAAYFAGSADALLLGPMVPSRPATARGVSLSPMQLPTARARIAMQQPTIDESSESFFAEYVQTDPVTGESKSLLLDEKEKLYLECLDSYYNENGKQILSDAEYEQLKLDIDFEGSIISTLSKDEIVFVLANKRFKMGKPVLDDAEYDALRSKLKKKGSNVVLHEGPTCNVESGVCKTDLKVDEGKQRLLYLPGTAGGLILSCELIYWTVGLDPILSIILGAIPSYFFGVWFTENVFAQKPLVTSGTCPDCQYLQTIYFGDLFGVTADGITGPKISPPPTEVAFKCANCKAPLTAQRDKMWLLTEPKNVKVEA